MLSVAVAAASTPAKPPHPTTAKAAAAPLSKYARAHLETMNISAPADEYFGKLKISFLGINNTLHDASITAGDHTTDPSIVNKVGFAEDALTDWEKKYPRDPQLTRTYYLAIGVEKKIWVQANQQRAWVYMNRIVDVFPNSYFGKLIKREIAIGFTEHYYTEPTPCETPSPTPMPTPEPTVAPPVSTATPAPRAGGRQPRATPSPRPTTAPTPTPTPSPTPEPTPSPSPQITQLGKGLKVQVLTPPCVAPPTPSPLPTAAPTAAPTDAPAPAPVSPSSPPPASPSSPPAALPPAPTAAPRPSSSPSATESPKPA